MTTRDFAQLVLDQVPYDPTGQQIELIAALARFCSSSTPQDSVFLLNGYAGTGKTSLCAALVRALGGVGIGTVLLAPTGRAAKVFSNFAGHPAYTIHRRIYSSAGNGITTARTMAVAENRSHNTVFIVDEASMIGGDSAMSNLLEDLVHYVYSGINCRMILLGDTAGRLRGLPGHESRHTASHGIARNPRHPHRHRASGLTLGCALQRHLAAQGHAAVTVAGSPAYRREV